MKGIRIAKPNQTVDNGTINQSMTSEAKSLRIFRENSWSQAVSQNSGPHTIPITHNLGYVPKFRVYGDTSSSDTSVKEYPWNSAGDIAAYCYADTTNLYIVIQGGFWTTPKTINGYYYIFEESI